MGGVVVGWIDGGQCDSAFTESLLKLSVAGVLNKIVTSWIHHVSGPVLSLARNELTEKFLRSDGDWLLTIDSDMKFEPDLVDRMLASADPEERPILGAVCYGMVPELGVFPAIFRLVEGWPAVIADPPPDTLMQVDAAGSACMLIHRSVFERTRRIAEGRWYDPLYTHGRPLGEDLSFCMRVKKAGIPIWVDSGLDVKHIKVKVALDSATYRKWRETHDLAHNMKVES